VTRRAQDLSTRETVLVVGLSAALAVLLNWPLPTRLSHAVPRRIMDPPFKAWELGWIGHALRTDPMDVFTSNAFWPLPDSLAFSDAMIGYGPFMLFAKGHAAVLTAYNLLFLFSYALAFVGAYLLARELGVSSLPAAVAGAAFAYAPYRLAHTTHLHVLSSGAIPLSLFLLVRGYRRRRAGLVVAGWLVVAWQVTLGFTLGLQLVYLLGILALAALVIWLRRGRPALPQRLVAATACGAAVVGAVAALQAQPYLDVAETYPAARRSAFEISSLSPVPKSFVAGPAESIVWGDVTARFRDGLRAPAEQMLFPGLLTVGLAVAGVFGSAYPRRLRLGLAGGTLAVAAFAVGFHTSAGRLSYLFPYRILYELAPGWEGLRTPGRLWTLVTLGLALLAGAGLERVLAVTRRRLGLVLAPLAVAGVLLEGAGSTAFPSVPAPPAGQRGLGGPQLHLPTPDQDPLYMFWSTDGFPPLVNGYAGFEIPSLHRLQQLARRFPDRRSVTAFRAAGIRYVVFHPELASGPPWSAVLRRPTNGLGIDRRDRASVVVFDLNRGR
jgi:hypothetical protein